jgi:hypothetical protein
VSTFSPSPQPAMLPMLRQTHQNPVRENSPGQRQPVAKSGPAARSTIEDAPGVELRADIEHHRHRIADQLVSSCWVEHRGWVKARADGQVGHQCAQRGPRPPAGWAGIIWRRPEPRLAAPAARSSWCSRWANSGRARRQAYTVSARMATSVPC